MKIKDANIKGGNIKGGNIKGGNIKGGNIKGGNIKGANIKGGNIKDNGGTAVSVNPVAAQTGAGLKIAGRIKEHGPVTFAEFMDIALYADSVGYYTSEYGRWGEGADYVTSIDISPAFASTFARQVYEMWSVMGSPCSFSLIEAGAGRGWFGIGILDTMKELYPDCFKAVKLTLVDKGMAGAGRAELNTVLEEKITRLCVLPDSVPVDFGIVISNELIDSFPVHRLVLQEGRLKEIFVDYVNGLFTEVFKEPSSPELVEYLAPFDIIDGQRVEVNRNAGKWLKSASRCFKTGFVITVDYGLPASELYAPGRPSTLVCHLRHTLNDNIYANVGLQDITAHIDFSNLVSAGRGVGLERTGFTSQKNFLIGAGVLEELQEVTGGHEEDTVEMVRSNRSIQKLIMDGGMGDIFKVLVQHKGFVETPKLRGFSFKDMSKYL